MGKKLTPFQQKGWTGDMLFEVIADGQFEAGTLVTLFKDDGTDYLPVRQVSEPEGRLVGDYIYIDYLKPVGYVTDNPSKESFVAKGGVALPKEENVSQRHTGSEKGTVTGGSSPNYYRKSISLPTTEDRKQFVTVDLEAGDVCELYGLGWNGGNVFKSMARGDNKDGVDMKYALDKELWFVLRRRMEKGLISHSEFWEIVAYLGLSED